MALEEKERRPSLGDQVWINGSLVLDDTYDRVWVTIDVEEKEVVHISQRTIGGRYEAQAGIVVAEEPYVPMTVSLGAMETLATEPLEELSTWTTRRISRNIVEHSYEGNHPYTDLLAVTNPSTYLDRLTKPNAKNPNRRISTISGQDLHEQGICDLTIRYLGLQDKYSIGQIVRIFKNYTTEVVTILWQDVDGKVNPTSYPLECLSGCTYSKEGDETA